MKNEEVIIRDVFYKFSDDIKNKNFVIDKTGSMTVETLCLRVELDPTQKMLNFYDIRKSPKNYIEKEIAWYDSQDLSVKEIGQYAKIWLNVCSKDEKKIVNSNYGHLIYSDNNHNQYQNVLNDLCNNPFSRRAVMIYNRPSMHYDYCQNGMSDFVCTLCHHFFIRDNKLISIVEMRSTDFVYGFFSDFPWFSTVQERLFNDLKLVYKDLEMGNLIWVSNSGHVYEKHFDLVTKIVEMHKHVMENDDNGQV